jgi:hypothetical protein
VQSFYESPNVGFLLPEPNGAGATYRSLLGKPPPGEGGLDNAELAEMLVVKKWFPPDIAEWMKSLPYWYEDDHAIHVHAGLDGEGEDDRGRVVGRATGRRIAGWRARQRHIGRRRSWSNLGRRRRRGNRCRRRDVWRRRWGVGTGNHGRGRRWHCRYYSGRGKVVAQRVDRVGCAIKGGDTLGRRSRLPLLELIQGLIGLHEERINLIGSGLVATVLPQLLDRAARLVQQGDQPVEELGQRSVAQGRVQGRHRKVPASGMAAMGVA